jgi:hypothetical protein
MEYTPMWGVGLADLQQVVGAETSRVLKTAGHDDAAQTRMLLDMLVDRDQLTPDEREQLMRVVEADREVAAGKRGVEDAFFAARATHHRMLADPAAGALGRTLSAAALSSWVVSPDPSGGGTVVMAKTNDHAVKWGAYGAVIGGVLGGPSGGLLGGAIGGLVGGIVDDCQKA